MGRYRGETITVLGVAAVVGVMAISMYRFSYEVWAAVLLAPVLVVLTLPMLRRALGTELAALFPFLAAGYVAKLVGAVLRFYVFFDVYGKNGDAETYFDNGNELASAVRAGKRSYVDLLPLARDTRFISKLSGAVMTVVGPSHIASFFIFATFAYWGTVQLVKAACMAIPGLDQRRYALACAIAPSLIFWPTSVGKEAWLLGCLGYFSLGIAKILTWNGRSAGVLLSLAAAVGIGAVRPHVALIFVAAATLAFVQGVVVPPEPVTYRRRGSLFLFAIGAMGALAAAATVAVKFLGEGKQTAATSSSSGGLFSSVSSILQRTTTQTSEGGSTFRPVNTDSPTRWPYAIYRTLTRPLLTEAHGVSSLIPALETTLFVLLVLVGYRRVQNLLPTIRKSPYLMYCLIATLLFGLAFSAVGNLGILVRQRSLITAFLVVVICLPPRPDRFERLAPSREFDPHALELHRARPRP